MYPAKFNDRDTKYAHETDTPWYVPWLTLMTGTLSDLSLSFFLTISLSFNIFSLFMGGAISVVTSFVSVAVFVVCFSSNDPEYARCCDGMKAAAELASTRTVKAVYFTIVVWFAIGNSKNLCDEMGGC